MNRQTGERTTLVRTLNKKIASSNRGENGSNVQRLRTPSHSDNDADYGSRETFRKARTK